MYWGFCIEGFCVVFIIDIVFLLVDRVKIKLRVMDVILRL